MAQGLSVQRSEDGGYWLYSHGKPISGPHATRDAAWKSGDETPKEVKSKAKDSFYGMQNRLFVIGPYPDSMRAILPGESLAHKPKSRHTSKEKAELRKAAKAERDAEKLAKQSKALARKSESLKNETEAQAKHRRELERKAKDAAETAKSAKRRAAEAKRAAKKAAR